MWVLPSEDRHIDVLPGNTLVKVLVFPVLAFLSEVCGGSARWLGGTKMQAQIFIFM
jgi:hypothetical protein